MMPGMWIDDSRTRLERRRKAEKQVKAKFPNIIEGSSGWYRAVESRLKRVK